MKGTFWIMWERKGIAEMIFTHFLQRAMEAHTSQLVWFRKLYLLFSRYLYINTIREIEVLDLELDLDLRGD